jgi:hypothetical protein
MFWIVSLTAHRHYNLSTWGGISGDRMYYFDGPDFTFVSKEWLRENVQIGPLGSMYPNFEFIMEGDTPSFLYLIPNGLGDPQHPDYGSWGGRYEKVSQADGLFADTSDSVAGIDRKIRRTNKATIWRWRDAYQNDFAARMRWTLSSSVKDANHPPELVVNGSNGLEPVQLSATAGERITLDATGTRDPDGNALRFRWFEYTDINPGYMGVTPLKIEGDTSIRATFTADGAKAPAKHHLILEVRDDGTPSFTRYRRVIVDVKITAAP